MASLLREQRRLALLVLVVLGLSVGSLPLVFAVMPSLSEVRVMGWPLPWFLLAFLIHPHLLALGWLYVRRAEANERAFAEMVSGEGD